MRKDLNVVIPVYNEEEIIGVVVQDWINILNNLKINYKLKLYNDGSTDNTFKELERLKKLYPSYIELTDKRNSGHGPTVLKSYLESLDADWIFQVDSDNEIKANNFSKFWDAKDEHDLIIGKRTNREAPLFRRFMTYISYLVVRFFYGKGIKDVNCPYRLMRTFSFEKVFLSIPKDTFAPNIIVSGMAVKKKLKIKPLDIQFETRTSGESSLSSNITKLLKISVNSFLEIIQYATKSKL